MPAAVRVVVGISIVPPGVTSATVTVEDGIVYPGVVVLYNSVVACAGGDVVVAATVLPYFLLPPFLRSSALFRGGRDVLNNE